LASGILPQCAESLVLSRHETDALPLLTVEEQGMNERIWIGFAALAGALAAGADVGFRHLVADPYRVDLGMIASRFGIYHALALIGVALLRQRPLPGAAQLLLAVAGWFFILGEGMFCLPLYLIGVGVAGWSGRLIVPGLIVLVAGWLALFAHVLVPRGHSDMVDRNTS
jgi:uncharacterized membrane protein YgdD (TMEM256/DUF423 family)